MPFIETAEDYRAKVQKFAREHPDASAADLAQMFPKMVDVKAIWARFNTSAVAQAKATRKAARAPCNKLGVRGPDPADAIGDGSVVTVRSRRPLSTQRSTTRDSQNELRPP